MHFESIYGVDFSGAAMAGQNIWTARLVWRGARLELSELACLAQMCGTPRRQPTLEYLVRYISDTEGALWGMDFPFALPIEVVADCAGWRDQLRFVRQWCPDAKSLGKECIRRALELGDAMHIRRLTDRESRTPFDCYHYRIIHQTFHGMRDILAPLSRRSGTAVLPFQYGRLPRARRVIVEACPSCTLKRLGLPHQNYKRPQGGPLSSRQRRTRHVILAHLLQKIVICDSHRRTLMRNPGGDALDSIIAALGAIESWHSSDHGQIARHNRYAREGRLYI